MMRGGSEAGPRDYFSFESFQRPKVWSGLRKDPVLAAAGLSDNWHHLHLNSREVAKGSLGGRHARRRAESGEVGRSDQSQVWETPGPQRVL